MTRLDRWLRQATKHLANDAIVQIRTEIREHYESARDTALANGTLPEDADAFAVNALGPARIANREYRRVFLTSAERRMLREGDWEARAICSRPWLKRLLVTALLASLAGAALLLLSGNVGVARDILLCAMGISPLVAALLLPINTALRGRVFRGVKWIAITGSVLLLFGPQAREWSWLLISCFLPLAWTEWKRASIRRKLPAKSWPRHLYL